MSNNNLVTFTIHIFLSFQYYCITEGISSEIPVKFPGPFKIFHMKYRDDIVVFRYNGTLQYKMTNSNYVKTVKSSYDNELTILDIAFTHCERTMIAITSTAMLFYSVLPDFILKKVLNESDTENFEIYTANCFQKECTPTREVHQIGISQHDFCNFFNGLFVLLTRKRSMHIGVINENTFQIRQVRKSVKICESFETCEIRNVAFLFYRPLMACLVYTENRWFIVHVSLEDESAIENFEIPVSTTHPWHMFSHEYMHDTLVLWSSRKIYELKLKDRHSFLFQKVHIDDHETDRANSSVHYDIKDIKTYDCSPHITIITTRNSCLLCADKFSKVCFHSDKLKIPERNIALKEWPFLTITKYGSIENLRVGKPFQTYEKINLKNLANEYFIEEYSDIILVALFEDKLLNIDIVEPLTLDFKLILRNDCQIKILALNNHFIRLSARQARRIPHAFYVIRQVSIILKLNENIKAILVKEEKNKSQPLIVRSNYEFISLKFEIYENVTSSANYKSVVRRLKINVGCNAKRKLVIEKKDYNCIDTMKLPAKEKRKYEQMRNSSKDVYNFDCVLYIPSYLHFRPLFSIVYDDNKEKEDLLDFTTILYTNDEPLKHRFSDMQYEMSQQYYMEEIKLRDDDYLQNEDALSFTDCHDILLHFANIQINKSSCIKLGSKTELINILDYSYNGIYKIEMITFNARKSLCLFRANFFIFIFNKRERFFIAYTIGALAPSFTILLSFRRLFRKEKAPRQSLTDLQQSF